jgi:integrase
MKGSMRAQRPGYWQLRVTAGTDPLSGKRQYRTRGFSGSKREAQNARAAPAAMTVRQMLDAWLAHIEHLGRSPTTLDSYRRLVEQLPAGFQSATLKKVTPKTLDDLYRHLMTERPRKPATVLRFHTVLHAAFRQAMKWEWIERSPAERATPPSVQRDEICPPDVLDVVRILEAAQRSRNPENAVVLRVLAATGCRRGEVCALQWGDLALDGDMPVLTVRHAIAVVKKQSIVKNTKTHSVRRVRLDDDTADVLRAHRRQMIELGFAAGQPLRDDDWVFARTPGSAEPMPPDRISQAWQRLCRDVGVNARLHDLRHLHASLLLDAGESIAVVAGRLGHDANNNSALLRRYTHMMPGADERAASLVGSALAAGRTERSPR